jgi:hypothetical protein
MGRSHRHAIRAALTILAATAVASAGWAGTTAAAASSVDSITGVEVAATSTRGTFVGAASGDLPGTWRAVVDHRPLPRVEGGHAAVTGGSFALTTASRGSTVVIRGALPRSSTGITLLDAGAGCTDQTFRIRDRLIRVGPSGDRDGRGNLVAVLTHHRISVLGHCVTVGASVQGRVGLELG